VKEAQAATGGVGRRHRPCGAIVEKAGASLPGDLEETGTASVWNNVGVSHPSSVGSRSEAGGSDVSARNRAGAGDARIRADGTEQPRTYGRMQAFGRPSASAAITLEQASSMVYAPLGFK
jgi:hypothetical protein